MLACLCPSPSEALHLLSPICISHLGSMPLGKFPTPVHLSLQSWTSCFCQLLRGPAHPASSSSQGKGQHVLLLPHLNLHLSTVPKQREVGTLYPERDGATSSTRTWSIFVGMSSLLCAVSRVDQGVTAISFSLEAIGRKRKIPLTSQDFIFRIFWSMPYCICLRCFCVLAEQRSKG